MATGHRCEALHAHLDSARAQPLDSKGRIPQGQRKQDQIDMCLGKYRIVVVVHDGNQDACDEAAHKPAV